VTGLVCSSIQTLIPNSHLYKVTYTRCRIDTIDSPDDEQMGARNIWRIEINIHEKELCIKLVIYKNYTEMRQCIRDKKGSTEHCKGNKTVRGKVATTRTEDGHK
jgi:hypothetical protein